MISGIVFYDFILKLKYFKLDHSDKLEPIYKILIITFDYFSVLKLKSGKYLENFNKKFLPLGHGK